MHEDFVSAPATLIPPDGFVIEFPEASKPEAGNLARELKVELENSATDAGVAAQVSLAKARPEAQDPGTILAVILGAKATVAIATGIALWLRRKNQGRIRLRFPDGREADISGVESRDVSKIVAALTKQG